MCSLSHSDRSTNGLLLTRYVITSYFFSLFCFFLFFWTISCECISLLCALCRTFSLVRRNTLLRARFHTFKESESNTYCGNLYFHWYVRAVFAMLISVSVQLAVERQLFFSFYHLLLFPLIVTIRSSCCQNTNKTKIQFKSVRFIAVSWNQNQSIYEIHFLTQLVHCLLFWHPPRFVLITKQCHILDLCVLFKRACANLWKPFDFRLKHKTKFQTQQVYLFRWYFDRWCKKTTDESEINKHTRRESGSLFYQKKVRFIIVSFSTIKTVFSEVICSESKRWFFVFPTNRRIMHFL